MRNPADVLERAEIHEEKGNYMEAERLYKKALVLKSKECGETPELAPFLYNLGMAQYANDHYDDALNSFHRLLDLLTMQQADISGDIKEIRAVIDDIHHEVDADSFHQLIGA
jgi:tetratricopeptide (TPR) repeat protein